MTTARMPHSAGAVAGRSGTMMSAPYNGGGAPPAVAASATPPGTLPSGTRIMVGPIVVTVQRYLSQGGFAHVYLVTTDKPVPMPVSATNEPGATTSTTRGETLHVLKRMAVPDKEALASVRSEVEIHKSLRSHPNIVHFIEASATALRGGGYEIFILMEYCAGGGIIDLMNARLRTRLSEAEVLKIFGDVAAGLSVMHGMQPPIMHRDLKVENILLAPPPRSAPNVGPTYKLCDFGSSKPVSSRKAAQTLDEVKAVEADLNKHTTLQYRAPEMVDVYQRRVIDEKADIWAMGVLLYKLCYYTTPFEENGGGPLAILNARYRFPSMPPYSQRLKDLIASMLQEHSHMRPTIEEVIVRVHQLLGTRAPASTHANKSNGIAHTPSLPLRRSATTTTTSGSDKHAPHPAAGGVTADLIELGQSEADRRKAEADELKRQTEGITPMRRGRPMKGSATAAVAAKFEQSAVQSAGMARPAGTAPAAESSKASTAAAAAKAEPSKPAPTPAREAPSPSFDGFADSFDPSAPDAFAPSSTSDYMKDMKDLTGEQPQQSPSPPTATPLNHSPALPGFDVAAASRNASARSSPLPPPLVPSSAVLSTRKPTTSGAAQRDDEPTNRFPSLAELDLRYPTDKPSAAAAISPPPLSLTSPPPMARSPSAHAAKVPGLAERASVSAMAGRYGAMASASKRVSVPAQAKPVPPVASKPAGLASNSVAAGSVGNRWRSQMQSSSPVTASMASPTGASAIEQRAAEQWAFEQRAAEQRAEAERVAEQRASEQRAAEQRAAEQREAEQRAAEQHAAEQKAIEERETEQLAASSPPLLPERQRDWLSPKPTKPTISSIAGQSTAAAIKPEQATGSAVVRPASSRAPPLPASAKPLKPWEREALEKEQVEKFGSLRSRSPVKVEPAVVEERAPNRLVNGSTSNGSTIGGGGAKGEAQERFRGVSSLISQWQANASGHAPGWGTVGGASDGEGDAKYALPKARKQSKDEDELLRRSVSPRGAAAAIAASRGGRLPSREV